MKTLKTDVIIPAYRPGEEFEKLLERLSAQKYPINKILVMNTEKKFWKVYAEQKRAMEQNESGACAEESSGRSGGRQ